MPSNISTPEGLLEALNTMGNKLNELVAENEELKVSQSNAVGIRKVIQSGKQRSWYQRKLPMSDKVDPSSLGHEKSKITLGLQIPRLWSCSRLVSSQKTRLICKQTFRNNSRI